MNEGVFFSGPTNLEIQFGFFKSNRRSALFVSSCSSVGGYVGFWVKHVILTRNLSPFIFAFFFFFSRASSPFLSQHVNKQNTNVVLFLVLFLLSLQTLYQLSSVFPSFLYFLPSSIFPFPFPFPNRPPPHRKQYQNFHPIPGPWSAVLFPFSLDSSIGKWKMALTTYIRRKKNSK